MSQLGASDLVDLEAELKKTIQFARDIGVSNSEETGKVKELRGKIEDARRVIETEYELMLCRTLTLLPLPPEQELERG